MVQLRKLWAVLMAATTIVQCLPGRAADLRPLPVPSLTLYPGDPISSDMMVDKLFSVTAANLQSYVIDLRQLEGKFARRTLVAGQAIALASIKERDAVQKGVSVPAAFESNGVVITTVLMPLESGTAGALIQARNVESGLVVLARVQPDGSLSVGEP